MITLSTFVKNEEACVEGMILSVKDCVEEIVVVDTGSTDRTVEICRDHGARVYQVGFSDFGHIRTLSAHLARQPWILMLDADERMEGANLITQTHKLHQADAYAFARKRWLDLDMTEQTEVEAYPDWQVRLFRNNTGYTFKRGLHEYFDGAGVQELEYKPGEVPLIHHFHDVFKDEQRKAERMNLYTSLARDAGVTVEGGRSVQG